MPDAPERRMRDEPERRMPRTQLPTDAAAHGRRGPGGPPTQTATVSVSRASSPPRNRAIVPGPETAAPASTSGL